MSDMDQIRATLAELAKFHQEEEQKHAQRNEEFARVMQEAAEERKKTELQLQKTNRMVERLGEKIEELTAQSKETDKEMRALAAQLRKTDRDFNGKWGSLIEALVESIVVSLLQERNIAVTQLAETTGVIDTATRRRLAEFDMIAVNGEEVVVVEVKTTLNVRKVNEFIAKMTTFKGWFGQYRDKKVYGAIAFIKADASSDEYAQKNKLFVIRAVGEGALILNDRGFEPREF